jgi:uncharacterized protein
VRILDDRTLAMPDWHGNDRIDSLRNVVRDGRASLMFMVPGSTNVVRVNGRAKLTLDEVFRAEFARAGKSPRAVLVFAIDEVYFQCARALIRSELWTSVRADVPSAGRMLAEAAQGDIDGAKYDSEWAARARTTMW